MFGYARINLSGEGIYVRFERVGPAHIFQAILSRFNIAFPLKHWNGTRRALQLPPSDLDSLMEFCRTTFGSNGYIVEQNTTTTYERSQ